MANSKSVLIYTPASQLRTPHRLVRAMLGDIAASRELAWRLLVRNFSARYRRTMLGYLWACLPPILMTAVFVFLHKSGYFTVGRTPVPYVVFLFSSVILWQVFSDAISMPLQVVQQSHSLLTKVNFPREALVLAGIGEVLFGFAIRFALMLCVLLWYDVGVSWSMIWIPCGVLVLIGLGVGLGLILTPLGILYHDIAQALPFAVYVWMFLTPVLYPVPQSWSSLAIVLNPVAAVLDTTRSWLLSSPPEHPGAFLVAVGISIATLLAGWLLYRLALPILLERIGSS